MTCLRTCLETITSIWLHLFILYKYVSLSLMTCLRTCLETITSIWLHLFTLYKYVSLSLMTCLRTCLETIISMWIHLTSTSKNNIFEIFVRMSSNRYFDIPLDIYEFLKLRWHLAHFSSDLGNIQKTMSLFLYISTT